MKRADGYSDLSRNNTVINGTRQKPLRRNNTVSPEIVLSQIWLHDNEANAVEIIELDSNDSFAEEVEQIPNYKHAWSYVNQDRFVMPESPKYNYKANSRARERKSFGSRNVIDNHTHTYYPNVETEECFMTDVFYIDSNESQLIDIRDNNERINHQINCFTIVKNPMNISSGASSVNDVLEFIDPRDIKDEPYEWNDRSYEEAYDPDPEMIDDTGKPSIWICSYKNKHVFPEQDYPIFSSEDSSSVSYNISEEAFKDKNINIGRVPTPIPGSYVPKLNLSLPPALPTVTEVTEPKHSSNESVLPNYNMKTSINSRIANIPTIYERLIDRKEISSINNVVNWMCLSPRKKLLRTKNTGCESLNEEATLAPNKPVNTLEETNIKNIRINCETTKMPAIHNSENTLVKKLSKIHDREETTNNNWIVEEKITRYTTTDKEHDIDNKMFIENGTDNEDVRNNSNNVNVPKSSQRSDSYLISEKVPSLHLSLDTQVEERITWFKRVIRCFRCFK